jgi:hypothetical protein
VSARNPLTSTQFLFVFSVRSAILTVAAPSDAEPRPIVFLPSLPCVVPHAISTEFDEICPTYV